MNTQLFTSDGGANWVKASLPRVYRNVRGSSALFSGNARHHLFNMTMAAGDPLIGQRVMIRYHVSIHDAGWGGWRVAYASVEGAFEAVPNTYTQRGHRFVVPEYSPNGGSYPNGNGRRACFHGMICGRFTAAGTCTLGFNVDGGSWEMRDDTLEQTVAMIYPLGG